MTWNLSVQTGERLDMAQRYSAIQYNHLLESQPRCVHYAVEELRESANVTHSQYFIIDSVQGEFMQLLWRVPRLK